MRNADGMSHPDPETDVSALPLASLCAVSLDTETTGLDTSAARIVQLGAVRLSAGTIPSDDRFDALVNPGVPIPPFTTAVHHISDSDVAEAEELPAVVARFREWAGGDIVIGWSIGFDMAVLKAEHERRDMRWDPPRTLDVRHLVQLVTANLPGLTLETAAAWLGIETEGRHSASGDALIAARIFVALLPKLREKGIATLAQAQRSVRSLTRLLEEEARAGWHDVVSRPAVPPDRQDYARIDSYPYRHRVGDIMKAPPVFVAGDMTLGEALAVILSEKVSSAFLHPDAPDAPYGIVTERDILRALGSDAAAALDAPVSRYAVRPLVSVAADEFVYRALGLMAARGFRHLGVHGRDGAIVGALSARDLLRQRAGDAVLLGDAIEASATPAELGRIWGSLTAVVRSLVREAVDPRDVAAVISRELRALTRRACEIAEGEILEAGGGPPPAPYAFMVLGSGGRGESLLAMDQDNALVYDAGALGGTADEWFGRLGRRVSEILDEVGVAFCKGGVMAANPEWRKDVEGWRETVARWIRRSRPEDILNADIFFDAVPVHGASSLADLLQADALSAAGQSRTFLQALSLNAADFKSPLRMLGRFRTESGRIDLKKGGIMPLFSTARVLALRYGIEARSTPARFEQARERLEAGAPAVDNLIEAHRILLQAILRQQLCDIEDGIPLSNSVAPAALSAHDREQLRWALEQVPDVADVLGTPLFG